MGDGSQHARAQLLCSSGGNTCTRSQGSCACALAHSHTQVSEHTHSQQSLQQTGRRCTCSARARTSFLPRSPVESEIARARIRRARTCCGRRESAAPTGLGSLSRRLASLWLARAWTLRAAFAATERAALPAQLRPRRSRRTERARQPRPDSPTTAKVASKLSADVRVHLALAVA